MAANGGEDTPGIVPKFCAKLLDGSPAAQGLIRQREYRAAFPESPPNFIRVVRYDYRFSTLRQRLTGRGGGGPFRRELVEVGATLDRGDLNALAPGIARRYEAALVAACRPWERCVLWLRRTIGGEGFYGAGSQLMWVCFLAPVAVRLVWWVQAAGGLSAVLGRLRRRSVSLWSGVWCCSRKVKLNN